MHNDQLSWHDHFADALVKSRPDPIITKYLDEILQWLNQIETKDSQLIHQSITKLDGNHSEFKATAYFLLEVMLFADTNNPYSVFGVKTGTSVNEIKTRYRRLVKTYHPDHSQIDDIKKRTAITEIINKAYDDIKNKRFKSDADFINRENKDPINSSSKRTTTRDYKRQTTPVVSPLFKSFFSRWQDNPERMFGNLKKSMLWGAGLVAVFFLFTLFSNPASKTVDEKYQSYFEKTIENNSNQALIQENKLEAQKQSSSQSTKTKNKDLINIPSLSKSERPDEKDIEEISLQDSVENKIEASTKVDLDVISKKQQKATSADVPKLESDNEVINQPQNNIVNNNLTGKSSGGQQKSSKDNNRGQKKESISKVKVKELSSNNKSNKTPKIIAVSNKKEDRNSDTTKNLDKRTQILLELSAREAVENQIKSVFGAFENYYKAGDAVRLASLYSKSAKENQTASRDQIYREYEDYFSSVSEQHIRFSISKIKKSTNDQYLVTGGFTGSVKKNVFKTRKFNSKFTILMKSIDSEMKILQMNY